MKKYLIALGGGALVVVSFALVVPSDAYGFVRTGDAHAIPAGCGAKAAAAIRSVYPDAPIADVQRWYCSRTLEDEADPTGARCSGSYHLTLTGEAWWAKVARTCLNEQGKKIPGCENGFGAWKAIAIDRGAGTITVLRTVHAVKLSAAQRQAHAPLLDGCLLDHNGTKLVWGDIVDFTLSRVTDGVKVQTNYATAEADVMDVAEASMQSKTLWPIIAEE